MNDPNQLSLNCERKISSRQVSKRRIKAVLFSTIFTKDGFCQIMTGRDCHGISDTGMNSQELAGYLDELIFSSTGKHIDSLQLAILKGVLNGQKYADIAKEYNCSTGHAKDEAYKLWQLLSDTLGEDINKSNFRATIERIIAKNSQFVGNIKIEKLNLCSGSFRDIENNNELIPDDKVFIDSIQKKTKRDTIPRLVKLGLTSEQIAEALDLPILEVRKIRDSQK
jgi:hypothetical protein